MFTKSSEKITNILLQNNTIDYKDYHLYRYVSCLSDIKFK